MGKSKYQFLIEVCQRGNFKFAAKLILNWVAQDLIDSRMAMCIFHRYKERYQCAKIIIAQ
jgi:hypothetical protein